MSQSSGSASLPASLCNSSWFQSLPADLQHWLQQHARLLVLPAGQRLFARGDAADGLYGTGRGAVRISGSDASGQEAIAAVLASRRSGSEKLPCLMPPAVPTMPGLTARSPWCMYHKHHCWRCHAQPQYWRDSGPAAQPESTRFVPPWKT
jgi:hypothetical protein